MPDKNEKDKRKEILRQLKIQSNEEFEAGLPMSRDDFKKLFDYLDNKLSDNVCDNTTRLTNIFLQKNGFTNYNILEWLANKGGYCDCEILANVEQQFN